ncbi:hypothetical protein TcCL_Unassigned02278 [Trypanosoma cruzi]|nr:hypothetical protein TcCL_Unassigned02278 [Trypanosoma cruzi]
MDPGSVVLGWIHASVEQTAIITCWKWSGTFNHHTGCQFLVWRRVHTTVWFMVEISFCPSQCIQSFCEPVKRKKKGLGYWNWMNGGAPVTVTQNFHSSLVKAHAYHMWVEIPNKPLADVCATILHVQLVRYVLYLEKVNIS